MGGIAKNHYYWILGPQGDWLSEKDQDNERKGKK